MSARGDRPPARLRGRLWGSRRSRACTEASDHANRTRDDARTNAAWQPCAPVHAVRLILVTVSAPLTTGSVLEMFRLGNRNALVTGAGSGLGFAFAEALAEAGANVACVDIDSAGARRASERVREIGQKSIACTADIADEAQVEAAFEQAETDLGPLQIVFANAGVAGEGGD